MSPTTTAAYTLSLHDALPICNDPAAAEPAPPELIGIHTNMAGVIPPELYTAAFVGSPPPSDLSDEELSTYEQLRAFRSEEHTSELQSLRHLVCRLLLEKKKKK